MRQRKDSEHLELVPVNGEMYYTDSLDSYWDWWKNASSYLDKEDEIDFCLIVEETVDGLFHPPFDEAEESIWGISQLNRLFQRMDLGAIAHMERTTWGRYSIRDQHARKWRVRFQESKDKAADDAEPLRNEDPSEIIVRKLDDEHTDNHDKIVVESDMAYYYRNKTQKYSQSD